MTFKKKKNLHKRLNFFFFCLFLIGFNFQEELELEVDTRQMKLIPDFMAAAVHRTWF